MVPEESAASLKPYLERKPQENPVKKDKSKSEEFEAILGWRTHELLG